jgi:hypothetical protein
MTDSMTQILSSGPVGSKVNVAVLGDGFAAGADQTTYNNKVQDLVLNGLFRNDYYFEDVQAFNVFRVNLISVDSGVGQKQYNNGTLISTTTKNTALGIYYSGSWSHCWLEWGPQLRDADQQCAQHLGARSSDCPHPAEQPWVRGLRRRGLCHAPAGYHMGHDRS